MAWPSVSAAEMRHMKATPSCFSAFLLSSVFFYLASSSDINTDAAALLAFKGNTQNQNLATWSTSAISSICTSWKGVTCNNRSAQRVIKLSLPGKSLHGPIPLSTIGSLDALDTLSLRSNKLSGEFPADLANCTSLRKLYLQNNNFSGPLPASDFSAWPLLVQLDLSFNRFNGQIPSSINNLTRLKSLYLQNNSLSGTIPAINITTLINFNVSYNQLDGAIPSSLSKFSQQSFSGNNGLCGLPLSNACSIQVVSPSPSSPLPYPEPSGNKKLSTGAKVGIVIASIVGAFLLGFLLYFLLCRRSSSSRSKKQKGDRDLFKGGRSDFQAKATPSAATAGSDVAIKAQASNTIATTSGEQESTAKLIFIDKGSKPTFEIEDLLRASAEVLGKGSLGTAYKAMLEDGLVLVVKRLRDVVSDREDFKQRVEMLGKLHHRNLVPLRAYYFAKQEKLLILDHMPNGSLSSLLHGKAQVPLEWRRRLRVAGTVARVLAYLHSQKVVHGNVKSSNVLMDGEGEACVTDYGLGQLAVYSPGNNKLIGYIPPEVTDMRKVTYKGDVYSFGVLLLELLTGKSPIQTARNDSDHDGVDLPRWVQSVVREQWTAEVFDLEIMKFEYIQEEMMQLLQIALSCVSSSPDKRPSMADVVTKIEDMKSDDDDSSSD